MVELNLATNQLIKIPEDICGLASLEVLAALCCIHIGTEISLSVTCTIQCVSNRHFMFHVYEVCGDTLVIQYTCVNSVHSFF